MRKRLLHSILTFLLTAGLLLSSWWVADDAYGMTEEQKLVYEAWRLVHQSYVDNHFNHHDWTEIRQQALKKPLRNRQETYQVIQEMLANLDDPFTRLLPPDQYQNLETSTAGELTGVGLQIALDNLNQLRVVTPIQGSPAERAGMKPLDIILEIDGVATSHFSLDEAAQRMRGPIGSLVTLTVQRGEQGSPLKVDIIRERIELNPVYAEVHPVKTNRGSQMDKIGYIRLTQFNANASLELTRSLQLLESQGVDAYILDLRNNPGGLLQAGIEVARMWLDEGTIVYTVNRHGVQESYEAKGSAITHAPLVVLVNEGTASASEILAGALQDQGRAQLIGEKTFGKGLIQSLYQLSDGAGLAVTVAKYETPNHRDINRLGIMPDRVVPLAELTPDQVGTAQDSQYQAAEDILVHLADQAVMAGAT